MKSVTSLVFDRWPRFAARHPWRVVGGAVLVLVLLVALSRAAGGSSSDSFSIPGTESQQAFDLLKERFPAASGDSATVVVRDPQGLQRPEARARVDALIAELKALPEVSGVTSPYDQKAAISADGAIARISVQYPKRSNELQKSTSEALLALRERSSTPDFQVEAGGSVVARGETQPPGRTELIGVAAAVAILLIAFGSVVAMGVPVITALLGLVPGFLLISIASAFLDMPSFTSQFGAMIGLGVGIDYALLIVTRFREGLSAGLTVEDSVVRASATAGRSVFFAGLVVIIAFLGLWAVGIPFVAYLGTASAIVVACSVLVAVFVLPAVLRLLGKRVDRWRLFGRPSRRGASAPASSEGLTGAIQRAPLPFLAVSAAVLIALALPVFRIELGSSDAGNNPETMTSRRSYDLLSAGFGPGFNGPILVAVRVDDPSAVPAVEGLPSRLATVPDVATTAGLSWNTTHTAATFTVTPNSSPQSQETKDLVSRLRAAVPQALGASQAKAYLGGQTAAFIDIGDKIAARLPVFLLAVIGLSFVLLMAVFRSILIPLMASMMNLLAIGAAFGLLVGIFQEGWLSGLFGVSRTGPVESFLPMIMFAVLFGLSMDYEVFLVTRIHEEYLGHKDNARAIARGQGATMRVISAAAAVMFAVFLSFGFGDARVIKEFGIGLASAIFFDAVLIRMLLVPSIMHLLGRANWWFPGWLERIVPRIGLEPHQPRPVEAEPAAPGP